MDKLFIKDQLGKLLIELAIDKVDCWTSKNLLKLRQNSKFPICIKINPNNWMVGLFDIKCLGEQCYKVKKVDKNIHEFYSKQAAFFYAFFESLREYDLSTRLLLADIHCAKYFDEIRFFTNKLNSKNVSKEKRSIIITKLSNAHIEYERAKKELNKSIKTAKYHKLWEQIP